MARQMVRPLRTAVKTRHRNSVGVVDGLVDYYKKTLGLWVVKRFSLSNVRKRQSRQ